MKVIAGICWFMESPTFLSATVASLSKIGVDHVVAVDGAYMLFPNGTGTSGIQESQAIALAADALGMGYTIHTRPVADKWRGGEVEKRNFLFQTVNAIAEDGDWYLSIDADEVIDSCRIDLKAELEATREDAAIITLEDRLDVHGQPFDAFLSKGSSIPNVYRQPQARLFRILPGFRVEANHYTYLAGYGKDEKVLWSAGTRTDDVSTLDLTGKLIIEHRQQMRDKYRAEMKKPYYEARTTAGIEKVYLKEGETLG